MTTEKNLKAIDPGVRIGHVHLKVSDLQRSIHFYCDVLGFEITQRYGSQAVFISAGGYRAATFCLRLIATLYANRHQIA